MSARRILTGRRSPPVTCLSGCVESASNSSCLASQFTRGLLAAGVGVAVFLPGRVAEATRSFCHLLPHSFLFNMSGLYEFDGALDGKTTNRFRLRASSFGSGTGIACVSARIERPHSVLVSTRILRPVLTGQECQALGAVTLARCGSFGSRDFDSLVGVAHSEVILRSLPRDLCSPFGKCAQSSWWFGLPCIADAISHDLCLFAGGAVLIAGLAPPEPPNSCEARIRRPLCFDAGKVRPAVSFSCSVRGAAASARTRAAASSAWRSTAVRSSFSARCASR